MSTGYNFYLFVDGLLKGPFCFNSDVPVAFENEDLFVELSETVIDVNACSWTVCTVWSTVVSLDVGSVSVWRRAFICTPI